MPCLQNIKAFLKIDLLPNLVYAFSSLSIASDGFQCYTFNSAGLHKDTVEDYLLIPMPPIPIRYIADYQVRHDLLTGFQNLPDKWLLRPLLGDNVPIAVGVPIPIDSSLGWQMTLAQIAQLGNRIGAVAGFVIGGGPGGAMIGASLGTLLSAAGHAGALVIAYRCHARSQCIYGMERKIFGSAVLIVP